MTDEQRTGANNNALPTINSLYLKALHLRGLAIALNDLDVCDRRTREASGAIAEAIEKFADAMAEDLSTLDAMSA